MAAAIRIHQDLDSAAASSPSASARTDGCIPHRQRGPTGNRRTLRRQLSTIDGPIHPATFFLLLRAADGDFCFPLRDVYIVRFARRHRPAQSAFSYRGELFPLPYALPALQLLPAGSAGGRAGYAWGDEQEQ